MIEDETTSLLPENERPNASPAALSPLRSIVAAFTIQLLLSIGSNMPLTPQTAILQDIVCNQYYNGSSPLNGTSYDCTIEPVVGEVAKIIGWEYAIENIPSTAQHPGLSSLPKFYY